MLKYSKKLIQIPEEEYLALLKLFTGDDSMVGEKVATDFRIAKVLTDKKLPELIKSKKYDVLAKKRKKLVKMIENRKITDIPEGSEPLPTSGIVPVNKPKSSLAETQEKIKENVINLGKNLPVAAVPSTSKETRISEVSSIPSPKKESLKKRTLESTPVSIPKKVSEVPSTPATPSPNRKEVEEEASPVKKTISKEEKVQKYLTDYNYFFNTLKSGIDKKELKKYFLDNRKHYGITSTNLIHPNIQKFAYKPDTSLTIDTFLDLLAGDAEIDKKEITGLNHHNPTAFRAIFHRMSKDKNISNYLSTKALKILNIQQGEGKKRGRKKGIKVVHKLKVNRKHQYIIDTGLSKFIPEEKTRGLIRKRIEISGDITKRKFKPMIWTKLGV